MVVATAPAPVYMEVAKSLAVGGSERKFFVHSSFVRDPRTGLHGLLTFRSDLLQIWSIVDYDGAPKLALNKNIPAFNAPITDVQTLGRGDDFMAVVTTAFSAVYFISFDFGTENLAITKKIFPKVVFLRLLPQRDTLIGATKDGKVVLFSRDGKMIREANTPHRSMPKSFELSPTAKCCVIGDEKGRVAIIDAQTLEVLYSIELPPRYIRALSFTADGSQLLIGGKYTVIQLFEPEEVGSEVRWDRVRCFNAHSGAVVSIAVSNATNVQRFASSSMEGLVCIWDFKKETPLHSIKLEQEMGIHLAFSPDGQYLSVTTDEGNVRIYKTPDIGEFHEPQDFIPKETLLAEFWNLEGNTFFDPLNLRKALGVYNDDEEGLVFWKLECDPTRKLRDIYTEVEAETTAQKQKEEAAFEALRQQRRRNTRITNWKHKVDEMRRTAQRDGRPFVSPKEPDFDVSEAEELNVLGDIDNVPSEEEPIRTATHADLFGSDDSDIETNKENNIAAEAGVLVSDSEEETPQLPVLSSSEDEQQPESSKAEGQLWATDDEEENRPKTTEEIRAQYPELVGDSTVNDSQLGANLSVPDAEMHTDESHEVEMTSTQSPSDEQMPSDGIPEERMSGSEHDDVEMAELNDDQMDS